MQLISSMVSMTGQHTCTIYATKVTLDGRYTPLSDLPFSVTLNLRNIKNITQKTNIDAYAHVSTLVVLLRHLYFIVH